ncbi:MAG: hypothetical protein HN348_29850 [Proteobacteria bacterium]|jgi:protein-S-isoprenylcysteine O-methyltransferase Ste14|nr:hypothetical protein [Pseudomonadota bacterium]
MGDTVIESGNLAIATAYWHPLSSTIAFVVPGLGAAYRISVEEKMLLKAYGSVYAEYCKNTVRLIPYLF